ncbi:chemotaxis protein CheX [Roseospira visakhapatnamensis]|uniref:CheY-specific phosphatase CheX n=1 Tax=Roseospira visakhapatnamensis TaxID=390880 RepID=A0A7W6RDY2_9PROT|nr:chemotaxis protein CheX [Roseospira visakhapatnamensis]MBB4266770.1 CheY-specific phosphatase CheX [Roseospira visakhapatnamensis]
MPLSTLMSSILRRTRRILLATAAINIDAVERFDGDVSALDLHDITAVGGFGEPIGVRAAFSFDNSLLRALYGRFTADIPVPRGQEDLFCRDTAAEIANMILGTSSGDFPEVGRSIAMTPVIVLTEDRHIDRRHHAVFGTMRVRAPSGRLDVHLLRPRELFDNRLNQLVV